MLRKARQRQVDSTDERLFARTIPQEESTHHDPAVRFERNSKRLPLVGCFVSSVRVFRGYIFLQIRQWSPQTQN
jgi:hypothetical protein